MAVSPNTVTSTDVQNYIIDGGGGGGGVANDLQRVAAWTTDVPQDDYSPNFRATTAIKVLTDLPENGGYVIAEGNDISKAPAGTFASAANLPGDRIRVKAVYSASTYWNEDGDEQYSDVTDLHYDESSGTFTHDGETYAVRLLANGQEFSGAWCQLPSFDNTGRYMPLFPVVVFEDA